MAAQTQPDITGAIVPGLQSLTTTKNPSDWIPYGMMVLLGLLWLYEFSMRKRAEAQLKKVLEGPETKVAASSPDFILP